MTQLRKLRDWLDSDSARRVVFIAMIVYFVWAAWLTQQTSHIVDCQARYAEKVSAVAMAHDAAAAEDRKATDQMIKAIVKIRDSGSTDTTPALKQYLLVRDATDKERWKHPLPEAPSTFCK